MKVLCKAKKSDLDKPQLQEKKRKAQDEADLIKKMDHPNIVGYVDSFWDNKKRCFCIVMELASNSSLREQIDMIKSGEGQYDKERTLKWIAQICNVMHYLENSKALRKDLKPENILIDSEDNIKITDFGLSFQVSEL